MGKKKRSPRKKGYAQRTREFNGETFQKSDYSYSHKSRAQDKAAIFRERGNKVRVVKSAGAWRIYKRRK